MKLLRLLPIMLAAAAPAFAEPWPEARLGPLAHWDAAYDAATGERTGKREGMVRQAFAVRAEGDGIGRIRDSRFSGLECAGEIKVPLGAWRQGEVRRNEYACRAKGRTERRVDTITIERIDFPCRDVPHCLQFTWVHEGEGGRKYDDRRYLFAPGVGQFVAERRR